MNKKCLNCGSTSNLRSIDPDRWVNYGGGIFCTECIAKIEAEENYCPSCEYYQRVIIDLKKEITNLEREIEYWKNRESDIGRSY